MEISFRPALTGVALLCSTLAIAGPGGDGGYRHQADPLDLPGYLEPKEGVPFRLPDPPPDILPSARPAPRFLLREVRLSGHTRIDEPRLQAVVQPFLGQSVGSEELEEIRLRLTRLYLDAGYVNSGALLPDQRIRDGAVEYRIVEGTLDEIRLSGQGRLQEAYLRDRLWEGPGLVLNTGELQERFRLLLSDPLIERLNGVLRPGARTGEGVLEVEVTRAQPYGFALTADNQGTPSTGSLQGGFTGRVDNLTGWGDRLALDASGSEGGWDLSGSWSMPLNRYDTRLNLFAEHDDSEVIDESLKALEITSLFDGVEIGLSHPLLNDPAQRLLVEARLAFRDTATELLGIPFAFSPGVEEDGEAHVRILRLVQEFTRRGADDVLAARSTINFGLDAFGATTHRDLPDSRFVSWLGQVQYARRQPEGGGQWLVRGEAQFTSDELLPSERFSLGGMETVRGYREGSYLRDNGWQLTLEYRHPLEIGGIGAGAGLQWALFADAGQVWDKGGGDAEGLWSLGAGLLWRHKGVNAELYLAHGFEETPKPSDHDLQDDGIHFRLSWDLF